MHFTSMRNMEKCRQKYARPEFCSRGTVTVADIGSAGIGPTGHLATAQWREASLTTLSTV